MAKVYLITQMQDSALHQQKNSSFSGKGLVIELFCILLAISILVAHYFLFTEYDARTAYLEPIAASQFLVRSSKTDELLFTLSLNSLFQIENKQYVPIWNKSAEISVSTSKSNYINFAIAPHYVVIRGKNTPTTSTLIANQSKDTIDIQYFLETIDSYKRDEKPKVLLLPIEHIENYRIASTAENIVLSRGNCQLIFKTAAGKFLEIDNEKRVLIFIFEGSKLHLMTTYVCTKS